MEEKTYLCIDLKCFFASVECVERGLDPFKANLVVADPSRGNGGICLAISPAMKALGMKNRCRIFEIPEDVEYITAMPRMKKYMEKSAEIYGIYLRYISPEDIHVYSIDECFLDITAYMPIYEKSAVEIAVMLMEAVKKKTGICATAGIGTNLFLAKIALDITAKHSPDNIGYLDKELFKKTIWTHRPITDIWNVGKGIAKRLEKYGVFDLEGVANMREDVLYKEFGVNAEYLIDHAKGYEPCTIKEIHEYHSKKNSISNGQILFKNYNYDDAFLALKEMVDIIVLELADKKLVTSSISLTVGYAQSSEASTGGTRGINEFTNSPKKIMAHFERLYKETTKQNTLIRRLNVGLNNVVGEEYAGLDMFTDIKVEEKERNVQGAIISIKRKYGKNAVLKGMNLQPNATSQMRNKLIGGHNGE